jgi:purine-binding chemotaxis protein CheW
MADDGTCRMVLFRVGTGMCAMPVQQVIETMRPQPVQALADTPHYILGVSVIRGAAVPVVDLAALVHGRSEKPARLVTVRASETADATRTAALAVTGVEGVATIPLASLERMPPLLGDQDGAAHSLGVADTGVMLLIDSARTVPDAVWHAVSAGSAGLAGSTGSAGSTG